MEALGVREIFYRQDEGVEGGFGGPEAEDDVALYMRAVGRFGAAAEACALDATEESHVVSLRAGLSLSEISWNWRTEGQRERVSRKNLSVAP